MRPPHCQPLHLSINLSSRSRRGSRFLAKSALREGHTSLSPVPTESINVPMYTYTIHHKHSVQCLSLLKAHTNKGRRRLAIGSTGTFPGGLAADLARCPECFFFCLPNVPRWSFPNVNKSKINHKSVSLDWQRRASCLFLASCLSESMHGIEEGEETARRNKITNLCRSLQKCRSVSSVIRYSCLFINLVEY